MEYFGKEFCCTMKNSAGNIAWRVTDLSIAMTAIVEKKHVILGGDVVTLEMKSTNDSWFYQPVWKRTDNYFLALKKNTNDSILHTMEYINRYVAIHGSSFLFMLVVCDGNEALLRAIRP